MRVLLAISGASGMIYARRLAKALKEAKVDVKTVVSSGAIAVAKAEGETLPKSDYADTDLAAPFASGSHKFDAMVVCPCSLKTLGEIANGVGNTLITRGAEVALKERRKLVLVVRETPLSLIAIKNMELVTLAGGVVMPAAPGFYQKPKTLDDLGDFIAGKVLDQLGVENHLFKRWDGKK
ncbi:MAG: UbiX family flavin prenyltransferase [Candidatus Micrarchaeota archaeon]|nr:UbiX family flavin prenyltransferase [Candidatus Micrarchaeota archaeon]